MEIEISDLANVYAEIAKKTDLKTAENIYELFRGQQIVFPVRFTNPDYIRKLVVELSKDGKNVKEISRETGYSDRRIRQIIKDEKT